MEWIRPRRNANLRFYLPGSPRGPREFLERNLDSLTHAIDGIQVRAAQIG